MGGAENLRACSTQPLSCAACLVNPRAGLLTDSLDARPAAFPLPEATVACFAGELADHSGATVRELHPLPLWLGFEHLGTNGEIVARGKNKRQEFSPGRVSRTQRPRLQAARLLGKEPCADLDQGEARGRAGDERPAASRPAEISCIDALEQLNLVSKVWPPEFQGPCGRHAAVGKLTRAPPFASICRGECQVLAAVLRVKREAGAIPARSRHCKQRVFQHCDWPLLFSITGRPSETP